MIWLARTRAPRLYFLTSCDASRWTASFSASASPASSIFFYLVLEFTIISTKAGMLLMSVADIFTHKKELFFSEATL